MSAGTRENPFRLGVSGQGVGGAVRRALGDRDRDESKAVQCDTLPLRSQTADGVLQDFSAQCVLYQCGRQLAYCAAMETATRDCDRISFTGAPDPCGVECAGWAAP